MRFRINLESPTIDVRLVQQGNEVHIVVSRAGEDRQHIAAITTEGKLRLIPLGREAAERLGLSLTPGDRCVIGLAL